MEKAKQFGLYKQINRNPKDKNGKIYNQNTEPTKLINKNFNKINSYQYLKSLQSHKLKYNILSKKKDL